MLRKPLQDQFAELIERIEDEIGGVEREKSCLQEALEIVKEADGIRVKLENGPESEERLASIEQQDREFFRLRQRL